MGSPFLIQKLPAETQCKAVSYITDPRDILDLERTDETMASLAHQCVEILRYDRRTESIPEYVDDDLVLRLQRIRSVQAYIRLEELANVVPIVQMPFISEVAFDFRNLNETYGIPISKRDAFVMMVKLVLSAFHTRYVIDETGNLIKQKRIMKPEDRFYFAGPYNKGNIVLRGNTFAYLSQDPGRIDESEEGDYFALVAGYTHITKLVTNIFMNTSSYEELLGIREFHFASNIEEPVTILNDIAYLNTDGSLIRAKVYMPPMLATDRDSDIFDQGYDFTPRSTVNSYFPAENPIELDIPFVIDESKIERILEWFPELTMVGLFLKDYNVEYMSLRHILDLLAPRNIKAVIYSLITIPEIQSNLVSFAYPAYIDISTIV